MRGRSPILRPIDYLLRRNLKNTCFAMNSYSIEDLRQRLIAKCRKVTTDMLHNVRNKCEEKVH